MGQVGHPYVFFSNDCVPSRVYSIGFRMQLTLRDTLKVYKAASCCLCTSEVFGIQSRCKKSSGRKVAHCVLAELNYLNARLIIVTLNQSSEVKCQSSQLCVCALARSIYMCPYTIHNSVINLSEETGMSVFLRSGENRRFLCLRSCTDVY